MTFVVARDWEPFESLYRRFKRAVDDAGILGECRRRRHYLSPSQARRLKRRRALRRRARQAV